MTPVLNPGASFTLKIEATPKTAAAIGSIREVNLKAIDGALSDTVRARTQVASG